MHPVAFVYGDDARWGAAVERHRKHRAAVSQRCRLARGADANSRRGRNTETDRDSSDSDKRPGGRRQMRAANEWSTVAGGVPV